MPSTDFQLVPLNVWASMRCMWREHEPGIVPEHGRKVPYLHPALRFPSQELDLLGRQVRASGDRCRPVVFLDACVDDEAARLEVLRHRRAGIWRRMLDVRPVDVLPRELEVRGNRFATVVGVADDQAADDEHAVLVQDVDRRDRRVRASSLPCDGCSSACALRNARSSSRMFSIPRKT